MGFAVRNDGIAGWRPVGSQADVLSNETYSDQQPAPIVPPAAPAQVTNYQIRAALIAAGMFDAANTAIMAKPTGDLGRQGWEYGNSFYRNSPVVEALALQLASAQGITQAAADAQVDQLFAVAATIT